MEGGGGGGYMLTKKALDKHWETIVTEVRARPYQREQVCWSSQEGCCYLTTIVKMVGSFITTGSFCSSVAI